MLVTFIIPAFNSANTIQRCLNSFLDTEILNSIEVIVVNDGSTDNTADIVQAYVEKYPAFYLINKENGGHGSVINYAAKAANGKYFKVIDSDDWVQTINLRNYIESLKKTNADVVFTHIRTIDSRNNYIREYMMLGLEFGREYSFGEFWDHGYKVSKVCQMHGITYLTEFYQSCNISLSEHISYEDQEYATLPFSDVRTVLPLDLFIYVYSLGNANQSVSDQNQVKNISQMETVFWKIEDCTPTNLYGAARNYFLYKKANKLLSCYTTAMIKNHDKAGGRVWVRSLRKRVQMQNLLLYKYTRKQYYICLILSYLGFTGNTMIKLQKFRLYRFLTRFVH